MSKTYTLTPGYFLYSFIDDIDRLKTKTEDPKAELAIDKDIYTWPRENPTILRSGDKLIVHGTEINEGRWQELCKSLYHIGWHSVHSIDSNEWLSGFDVIRYGITSEGDCFTYMVEYKDNNYRKREHPCKFDWSQYGVIVPNSTDDVLAKKKREVEEKATQVRKLEKQVQELEADQLTKLRLLREDSTKTKELEGRNKELTQQLNTKATQVRKLEKQVQELEADQLTKLRLLREDSTKTKEPEGRNKELTQQLNTKATQVRKLEEQVQELEAELTKLRLLREDCTKAKEDCTKTKEIEGRDKELTQQLIANLEHKLQKKDVKIEKSQGKVKELKQQLNKLQLKVHERDKKLGKEEVRIEDLKQQVSGLGQQVTGMWQQLKSKDKWAQDHMRQLVDTGFVSPTAPSLVRQKEFEKKLNGKIDQMVSLLHNIENMVKFKN